MENFTNSGLPENEKNRFQKEYSSLNPPVDLEKKIINELRARKAFKLQLYKNRPYLKPVFLSLLLATVFIVGYSLGNKKSVPSSHGSPYLLLLSNPPGFLQGNDHAKEYGTWFKNIGDKNAQGDELKHEGWLVKSEGNSTTVKGLTELENQVTGYFIVNASSDKEALSIAASCPHIKYNGMVTVRPIQINP
jgi:hypothetical protein